MAPRIVGGSSYNNPYANPVALDPFAANGFSAFDDARPETPRRMDDTPNDPFNGYETLKQSEYQQDWVGEIKNEFQDAQRRQSAPRPRGKSQDAQMREMLRDATNLATGGNDQKAW